MVILISAFAVVISFMAIFINQWITFLPVLGIGFQYNRRRHQIGTALLAIFLVSFAYLLQPSTYQLITLIIVVLLTPLSGFINAGKFRVPVDRPLHIADSKAEWSDHDRVLGYISPENIAVAWSLETLIPNHIVNDSIIGKPLLVGRRASCHKRNRVCRNRRLP